MTTPSTFPFNSTLSFSPEQATLAFQLRKNFPSFVKDAKGGERGGINIRLHDDGIGVTVGATKQSFINVVSHKIQMFFASQARRTQSNINPKAPPTPANAFTALQEKTPDTHVVVFGKYRLPLKPGATFPINSGGGRLGVGQYVGPSQNDLARATQDILALASRPVSNKTPALGKAKSTVVPAHSWTGSHKVTQGSGLIRPPTPVGWFGLKEMEERSASTLSKLRHQKVEKKTNKRRQNKDQTDDKGTIVDLEEYLQARKENEMEAEIDLEPPSLHYDDDLFDDVGMAYEEPLPLLAQCGGDDVPDNWDDDC